MKNINVVLPIAGLGKRFVDGGYETPKPLIQIGDKTILEKSLESLEFSNCNLIFVVRQEHVEQFQIDKFILEKFGKNCEVIIIDYLTEGALCTCLLAEQYINKPEPLIIFTPDCYFEPMFFPDSVSEELDGMVVVFESESPAHSYVRLDGDGLVTAAAEKEVISEYAVGGLYFWKSGERFVNLSKQMIAANDRVKNEFYICPVFNYLIEEGGKVGIDKNTKHVILGTPKDLEQHIENEK